MAENCRSPELVLRIDPHEFAVEPERVVGQAAHALLDQLTQLGVIESLTAPEAGKVKLSYVEIAAPEDVCLHLLQVVHNFIQHIAACPLAVRFTLGDAVRYIFTGPTTG